MRRLARIIVAVAISALSLSAITGAVRAEDPVDQPTWVHTKKARGAKTKARADQAKAAPVAASAAHAPAPAARVYRIGSGDRLKISVYNAEKLSGEYSVAGDGKMAFPMIGRVNVAGQTLDEVTATLTQKLGDGYLLHPNVTVEVVTFRPVFILGEVEKPGQYPYAENMTIYSLVAQAGGFTYRANRKTIKLRHEGDAVERKYSVISSSAVQPGDTVYILQRYF